MDGAEFRIETDSPAGEELMFWRIVGHEGLSRPSFYELTVLSRNRGIEPRDVLGRAFDVVIVFQDADGGRRERHCQGHAVRFTRVEAAGRYFEYRIVLRSWFWLLTRRRNSRILQDKPVLEVFDAVLEDSPIKRFKKTRPNQVIGTHKPRRYCVQHQESDYGFLSRLLEEEGIYYWFDAHGAPGTMHLSDASDVAHEKLPEPVLRFQDSGSAEPRFNTVFQWLDARHLETGKHSARDSDFKAIRRRLGSDIDVHDEHELGDFEHFEFPGGYFQGEDADNTARVRGDELVARRERHWALTHWPEVAAGSTFRLEGDPDGRRDGDYLIAGCTFVASHPGYEGAQVRPRGVGAATVLEEALADDAVNAGSVALLREMIAQTPQLRAEERGQSVFLMTLLPTRLPFRAPRLSPRPTMPGPQTAIVVGPPGDELHVDEHGRVKVHFHWDRYDKSDDKSTCWVRVSQPWAGKGWGGYFIPRIGQEVIVDFLNGDPDRPIIMGRMYNDDQPIPYSSPTQSGFRSRSTPGGGVNNFNEIQFEDKKGEEKLIVHAELDMASTVERDDAGSVGRDQSLKVGRDQTTSVQNNRTINVTNNETHSVKVDQKLTVGANRSVHVVANQSTSIDANQSLSVKGNQSVHVTGNRTDTTLGSETRTVTGAQTVTVAAGIKYKAPTITLEAGHLEFKVTGGNSMKIDGAAAPFTAAFQEYTLVSNSNINMVATGNINATSVGSNTTVLGPNTSGYIGVNSEANLGIARSTFLGLSLDNALGLSVSNFLGVALENTAAIRVESVAALSLERTAMKVGQAPLFSWGPGAAAADGGAAPALLNQMGAVASVAGLAWGISGVYRDVGATFDQYSDAIQQLDDLLGEANKDAINQVPGLRERLARMKALAENRLSQGHDIAGLGAAKGAAIGAATGGAALGLAGGVFGPVGSGVGGVVGGVGGGVIGGVAGFTSSTFNGGADDDANALINEGKERNKAINEANAGTAPDAPAAPGTPGTPGTAPGPAPATGASDAPGTPPQPGEEGAGGAGGAPPAPWSSDAPGTPEGGVPPAPQAPPVDTGEGPDLGPEPPPAGYTPSGGSSSGSSDAPGTPPGGSGTPPNSSPGGQWPSSDAPGTPPAPGTGGQ